jgi:hypothetical protein
MLFIGLAEWPVALSVLPEEQGIHPHYATGDRYGDGAIEQPTQKTTWIPDTQSGILQTIRRCISNLNPRKLFFQPERFLTRIEFPDRH